MLTSKPRQPAQDRPDLVDDATEVGAASPITSRRAVVSTGAAGLAATAFLAACSSSSPAPGLSGAPSPTTIEAPAVPRRDPTQAQIQFDKDVKATANSLELLAAEVYRRHGSELDDPELVEAAARFVDDHTAAADVFAAEVSDHEGIGQPNEFLLTNTVEPIEPMLTTPAAVADMLSGVETSIAATYISVITSLLDAEWRQTFAVHAAAAARRAAVFGSGGTGSVPTSALFPLTHLVSESAFLTPPEEEAAAEGEEATDGETTTTAAEG